MENTISKKRFFSIELKSKNDLRNITLVNGSNDSVLVEGTIGELLQATFAEGVVLKVIGKNGVLRLDLEESDIERAINQEPLEVNKE